MAKIIRKIFGMFRSERFSDETISVLTEGRTASDMVFDNADDAIASLHRAAGIA